MRTTNRPADGFTLVELLIVIGIIGTLAGLAFTAIGVVTRQSQVAIVTTSVSGLSGALARYVQDEGIYPGQTATDVDEDTNQFPLLYRALFGERRPDGPGGRSAPYLSLKEEMVHVWDDSTDVLRPAKRSELHDDSIDKFFRRSVG